MAEKLAFEADDLDAAAILRAIACYQRRSNEAWGETIVPEHESDLGAAILAEICRSWLERMGFGIHAPAD